MNSIVIPTSLFTETVFNARVQNETLSETPIYSDDEEIFKFISVGRDGNTVQACEEIDFIIIRFDISSEDAMVVLNLLLECLVNETTNETAIVYSYVSTKENGIAAVMMNLPFSVLGLIPWYCDFENSLMGSKPETFEDWFWKPLKTIGKVIVGVIIFIGMGFVELFTMMVDFFKEILMDILPILQYILWLIICALVLIFIWIMFAITLIMTITTFVMMIPFFTLFGILIDGQINISMNSLTMKKGDDYTMFKYEIGIENVSFFAFKIPTVYISFIAQNTTYEIPFNFFTSSLTPPNQSIFENMQGTEPSQSSGLEMSSNDSEEIKFEQFWNGATIMIGAISLILSLTCNLLSFSNPYLTVFSVILSIISITLTTFLILEYASQIGWI